MTREDWKTAVVIFIMATLILKYFVVTEQEHQAFEVSSRHIKYHCNWTSPKGELHHVK
jgi:hypothetical protein